MKLSGYEAPLGISITSYDPKQVKGFVENGFTHFEIGIPAFLEGETTGAAFRGKEEALVGTKEALFDAIEAEKRAVWSVHLPFGEGWDIASYDEKERDQVVLSLKRIMDLTAHWKMKIFVLHGCLEPVADDERPVRIARAIQSMRQLNAYAKNFGAQIALENLPRSCLANNAIETRAMMLAAEVPICFDVNHLLSDTHDVFLDALASQIVTTHLSDYDRINERHWLPGKGIVPWKEIFLTLMKAGYRGPFLFETGIFQPEELVAAFRAAVEK